MSLHESLPRPLASPSLQERAEKLGIQYLLITFSCTARDMASAIVHVSAANKLEASGIEQPMLDFPVRLDHPKLTFLPDLDTLVQLPWQPEMAWITGDLYTPDGPFIHCPRLCLKKVIQELDKRGLEPKTAVEVEFSLCKKDSLEPLFQPDRGFQDGMSRRLLLAGAGALLQQAMDYLHKLNWQPLKLEKEYMGGQYEISIQYTDALQTADRHLFIKFMLKTLAEREGCRAVFMPRPSTDMMGNGCHLNVSLWGMGENLMPGSSLPDLPLSQVAVHFAAGIMENADAMCAMSCPYINSYKRLHSLNNFLSMKAYSLEGRWPMLRVPHDGGRLEYRVPDSSVNPYFLNAHVLAAGLDGIEGLKTLRPEQFFDKNMELETPLLKEYSHLPKSLDDALRHLGNSDAMKRYLGEKLVEGYIKMKEREVNEFRKHVSQWEMEKAEEY